MTPLPKKDFGKWMLKVISPLTTS